MSSPEPPVSRARRRLGLELRTVRTLAGKSQAELAAALGRTQGVASRAENGHRVLSLADTQVWLTTVSADAETRERILTLTEAVHAETSRWSTAFGDKPHLQDVIADRDRESVTVRNFQPTVLPGLLQTVDYARVVIRLVDGQRYHVEGVDQAAALGRRIGKQEILREPGRTFQFIVAERLLHWEPEPGVLAPQLAQLIAAAQLEAVELAVLPATYAGSVPWHNFILRHPADGSAPYVMAELLHGAASIEDEESVGLYLGMWERLWEASVRGDAALDLIREAAA